MASQDMQDQDYTQLLRVVKPSSVVNGLKVPLYIKQEDMEEVVSTFKPDPSDIWISTYAKAGTTWTQQIVKLIRNKGQSDTTRVNESVPWFEANNHFKVDLSSTLRPRIFKSHMTYETMPCGRPNTIPGKYIYVARNPKDLAVSYYYHYLKLQVKMGASLEWDLFYRNFLKGTLNFGNYFDHVLSWWPHRDDYNVLFLMFEDMKKDLSAAVGQIATFIGIDISGEQKDTIAAKTQFSAMKNDDTANYSWSFLPSNPDSLPFMRKGEVGDWKNHFTPEQSIEMDKLCSKRLEGTSLVFTFEL